MSYAQVPFVDEEFIEGLVRTIAEAEVVGWDQ